MALTGTTNEQKIWNYFKSKGLNNYGIAGIMGNLYAESGLMPNNLQNTGNKKLGMTDDEYVKAVDYGTYTNFVKDSQGFGIAQWTYWSRKQNLYNYAKSKSKSIGDLEMQLDFLYSELSSGYSSVLATLKSATSVLQASNAVLLNFERPADQSTSVQNKRASYGQSYYDKFATSTQTVTTAVVQTANGGKMTNTELIKKLQNIVDNYKTLYVMGCFGAPLTGSNVSRYCTNHVYNKQSARTAMIKAAANQNPPVYGFDCVNMIKGILWGWTGDASKTYGGAQYAINGVPDISADGMITKCLNVSTDFSNIVPGEAVWMTGHIGVYIGDGKVIECSPAFKNCVQVTACWNVKKISGMNGRTWTKHGKLPYITYTSTTTTSTAATATQSTATAVSGQYKVNTTSQPLNCRSTPNGTIIGQFKKGAIVTATQQSGNWMYVSDGTLTGWASKDYLLLIDAKQAITTLVSKGIINTPDYWTQHYKDLNSLDRLLVIMASTTTKTTAGTSITTAEQALDLMTKKGLINSPDYWKANYSKVNYLGTLLIKFANSL